MGVPGGRLDVLRSGVLTRQKEVRDLVPVRLDGLACAAERGDADGDLRWLRNIFCRDEVR